MMGPWLQTSDHPSSNQVKGSKGSTNGVAWKQKADPKKQVKKSTANAMNGTGSLKRNGSGT